MAHPSCKSLGRREANISALSQEYDGTPCSSKFRDCVTRRSCAAAIVEAHENPDRDGRVAAPDEWRGADTQTDGKLARTFRPRREIRDAAGFPFLSVSHVSGNS